MDVAEFLSWFYSKGLDYYLKTWSDSINWVLHYFSLGLLLKTLFSPWKRLIEEDVGPGFDFQRKFEIFTFNLISRGIGAVVRLVLFFVGIVAVVFYCIGGAIGFVFWMALPFFGIPIYDKYKRQPAIFVPELLVKIKTSEKAPLEILFTNPAAEFVLSRVGITKDDLVANAQVSNVDFGGLHAQSFQEVISFLLEKKLWSDEYLNKKEVRKEDFLMAAGWWDQKQTDETKLGDGQVGRPGIALELTFGYTPTLDKYSVDLSAPQSYSHRLIGRQPIVSRMERVLTSGSSVLLVGQPGVGKKTVVLEFARRAAYGELGRTMVYKRVLELDYNSFLSESKDLNLKKKTLSSILLEASYAGNIILMIRDLHRLTNPEVEGYDFTDIFETHLEKRELKIIAVSGNVEYERFLASNLRLRKFLEKVEITPVSKEDAMLILVQAAQRWESLTNFIITLPSLRNILQQSDRYITEVPFPEKALELLDAVITFKQQQSGGNIVTVDDTNSVLEEKTGVSFARLTEEEKGKLDKIEDLIHERLVDQNAAINLIGKTLRAKTVGVIKEDRPLGSFLFLGPTGVGKTETAKVLANVYYGSEKNILRFDMAEYSGSEGLERLIGSVNKNQPGALTTAIKNRPASLLLLDEIEKATKEITNLFLALLDEGYITDAFGKKVICHNLFVIGTSNAGAEYIRQLVQKEVRGEELQNSVVNHILEQQIFSPEFLNRFDGVVVYEPLEEEVLIRIANLMLSDLSENLKNKNIYLKPTSEAAQKLAKDGYEPAFGARAMRRIVNITLGDLIGKAILEGKVKEGDKIKLVPGTKKEEFSIEKI
jgi:ATP-dependent Clp protease ATP-binding subunit ClpC